MLRGEHVQQMIDPAPEFIDRHAQGIDSELEDGEIPVLPRGHPVGQFRFDMAGAAHADIDDVRAQDPAGNGGEAVGRGIGDGRTVEEAGFCRFFGGFRRPDRRTVRLDPAIDEAAALGDHADDVRIEADPGPLPEKFGFDVPDRGRAGGDPEIAHEAGFQEYGLVLEIAEKDLDHQFRAELGLYGRKEDIHVRGVGDETDLRRHGIRGDEPGARIQFGGDVRGYAGGEDPGEAGNGAEFGGMEFEIVLDDHCISPEGGLEKSSAVLFRRYNTLDRRKSKQET